MVVFVHLKTNHRLKNATSRETKTFINKMLRVGNGICSADEDHHYWFTRFFASQNREREQLLEADPTTKHLVKTNDEADEINAKYVAKMSTTTNNPVFAWLANNTTRTAELAQPNDVWGLRSYIGVCRDAPVLLLANLWTEAGLVNGSQGTVQTVIFDENSQMFDVPRFVVVDFKGYTGPAWIPGKPTWVPIPAVTASVKKRISSQRTQIPLVLARAITIHKAQGMTLKKVIAHLSGNWHQFGIDYTAISRVSNPDGLVITDVERTLWDKIATSDPMKRMKAEMHQHAKLANTTQSWTDPLHSDAVFNTLFQQDRHGQPNHAAPAASADVDSPLQPADILDPLQHFEDPHATIVAQHTASSWRRAMQQRNTATNGQPHTKVWQVLAQPYQQRKRSARPPRTDPEVTKAMLQFAIHRRPAISDQLKSNMTRAQLIALFQQTNKPTISAHRENPTCNPFSFTSQTARDAALHHDLIDPSEEIRSFDIKRLLADHMLQPPPSASSMHPITLKTFRRLRHKRQRPALGECSDCRLPMVDGEIRHLADCAIQRRIKRRRI